MHEPYGASKITNKQLPISTSLLHARSTDLLTDAHGPTYHVPCESCDRRPPCTRGGAPCTHDGRRGMHGTHNEVHKHLRKSLVATCFRSLHTITITQLQVAQTTSVTSAKAARQLARSDRSGNVASQGRMGPLGRPINNFPSA